MDKEMKRRLAESVRDFRLPRYSEIPTVGLYLEQTTKYINGYLAPLGFMEITPSMVSNYVKKGLISAPKKRQYFPEQICYLFFVAIAKNLVAIEDIGLLIALQKSSYTLNVAYDYLCDEMENIIGYVFGLKDSMDSLGVTQSDEKDLLRSLAFSAVQVLHMRAYFSLMRQQKEETL